MPEEKSLEKAREEESGTQARHGISLGNADDVYQVCFAFIEDVSEVFVRASTGEITGDEAESRMQNVTEWLTAALLGRVDGIEAKEGWTGAPLARSLVADLSGEISRLPREAQEALSSTDGVVLFSAMLFMHEVQETVSRINHVPEPDAEKAIESQGRAVHELCKKWTDRFTGKGKPRIILPEGL